MNDHLRGYKIYKVGNEWFFDDTSQPTIETWMRRPCGYCGRHNTADGHDGCLGVLPKVINACCGHGQEDDAYVQFNDGSSVYGKEAINIVNKRRLSNLDGWADEFSLRYAKRIWPSVTEKTQIILDWGDDKTKYTLLGLEGTETVDLIVCNEAKYAKWGYATNHDILVVIEASYPFVTRIAKWDNGTWENI